MKTILAKELNEELQEQFFEHFYMIEDNPLEDQNDRESLCPWGAPWLDTEETVLIGETIENMAENYWSTIKDQAFEILEEIARNTCKYCYGSGCNYCLMISY